MNCKQGDLAVIVRSMIGNEGSIVKCVNFLPTHLFTSGFLGVNCWRLEREIKGQFVAQDAWLRPIRDSDSEDEILRMVGNPVDSLVGA